MTAAGKVGVVESGITVSLDANGGDRGLEVSLPGAVEALRLDPDLHIILVGDQESIRAAISLANPDSGSRLSVQHAPDILPMDAKPATALRRGNNSSMWQALQLVTSGAAGACVSAGSTAALLTLGIKLVGMLPAVQRPPLMGHVPSVKGHTGMLDLGANLNVSSDHLVQFAVMGSVAARVADGIASPRIGLLNVGHEDNKGHDVVREAHQKLKELPLNYVGFVEGNDIFSGQVDVAVCDGFVGNLILKSNEGLARLVKAELSQALDCNIRSRLGAGLARPALQAMLARLDPSAHNGAPLLGLKGVVVKSHGSGDRRAMTRAILEAGREARGLIPEKIGSAMRAFQLENGV